MRMNSPLVIKAYHFANTAHKGHMDDLDTSYFHSHCVHVHDILQVALSHSNSMFKGEDLDKILASALLHDTVEDADISLETITEEFGADVAKIVHAVTHSGINDEFGYYFPRLRIGKKYDKLIHMAVILKFADRLSNIIRGGGWSISRLNKYLTRSIFWKTFKMRGSPVLLDES